MNLLNCFVGAFLFQNRSMNPFVFILCISMIASLSTPISHAMGKKKNSSTQATAAPTATPTPAASPKYQVGAFYQPFYTDDISVKQGGFTALEEALDPKNDPTDRKRTNGLYRNLLDDNPAHTAGTGWSSDTYRVPRIYSERQPYANGKGEWLNYYYSDEQNTIVDLMRDHGIDFISHQISWQTQTFGDTNVPFGYPYYNGELGFFIRANQHRDPSRQVLFSVFFGPDDNFDQWVANADGTWISSSKKAPSTSDYVAVFNAKIQYFIDHCFNVKDDQGRPLYYFREGKPVVFIWESGGIMSQAKRMGTSLTDLLKTANAQAVKAGYTGIYFVDASNSIVNRQFVNASGGNYVSQDFQTYLDLLVETGFNAATAFLYRGIDQGKPGDSNFYGYGQWISGYAKIWNLMVAQAKKHSGFKYYVPVSPGWDSRPIGETGKGNEIDISRSCDGAFDSAHNSDALPYGCSRDNALFSTMLQKAKSVIDQNQDTTDQILMVGTWNDVNEGTHIIPTVGDKGAHAQAIKDLFGARLPGTTPTLVEKITASLVGVVKQVKDYVYALLDSSPANSTATASPTPAEPNAAETLSSALVTDQPTSAQKEALAAVSAITPTPTSPPLKTTPSPTPAKASVTAECEGLFNTMISKGDQWQSDAKAGKCADIAKELAQSASAPICEAFTFKNLSGGLQTQIDDSLDNEVTAGASAASLYQSVRQQKAKEAQALCNESEPLIAVPVPTIAPLKTKAVKKSGGPLYKIDVKALPTAR